MGLFNKEMAALLFLVLVFVVKLPEMYCYVGFRSAIKARPQGKVRKGFRSKLNPGMNVSNVTFPCGPKEDGDFCVADIWLPDAEKVAETASPFRDSNGKYGAVVMAHGFGSTRDMGLCKFAEVFANSGLIVLAFDYRRFGQSSGYPRHLVEPESHVDDYLSALNFVRKRADVDPNRVCLWGTSYAGGHVLTAAGRLSEAGKSYAVRCVISQMPFLNTIPSESKLSEIQKRGFFTTGKMIVAAISGKIREAMNGRVRYYLGLLDLYIGIYGHSEPKTERILAMSYWEQMHESEGAWLSKHLRERPNDWANAFLASGLFNIIAYRPIDYVPKISKSIPVQFIAASDDHLCPTERVVYASELAANGEYLSVYAGHFTMYMTDAFKTTTDAQTKFLNTHLSV